jgi:hypothetical protein
MSMFYCEHHQRLEDSDIVGYVERELGRATCDEEEDEIDRRWTSIQTCPTCHQHYTGYPALSRKDNATDICSDCGTREALEEYVASRNSL